LARPWQELSVLIAGCGSIGRRHARVLAGLGVHDLRSCDPVAAQRRALTGETPGVKVYESFAEGLAEEPDAVFICTPTREHIPMALQALEMGAHVFCEKPLCERPEEADALVDLVRATGRQVMVGLCFRYHAGLLQAKRYLEGGRIGRLVSVRALMGEHLPDMRPDYRNLFSTRYAGAFDLIHEVDLAVWFANRTVRDVYCISGTYSDIGIEAPDLVEILIGFEDRCAASIHLDFFQRPRRRQTELVGTEGVVIVEFARWERCTVSLYEAARGAWRHEELSSDRDDMFRAEDREFLQSAAAGRPVTCDIAEGLKSVAVVALANAAGRG